MVLAKCRKCGGAATADTYDAARKLINHAVGLSRGIKCGDSYNCVDEIGKTQNITPPTTQTPKPEVSKPDTLTTQTPPTIPPTTATPKPDTTISDTPKPESSFSPKKLKKTKSSF